MSRLPLFVCRTDKKEIKKEHINDFKQPTNTLSVISRHKLDHDHMIDWNNTIILDSEQSYYKRMVSEILTKRQNGLKQTE